MRIPGATENRRSAMAFWRSYTTFLQCFVAGDDHDRHHPPPPEAEPHREEVAKALDDAFKRFTLQGRP